MKRLLFLILLGFTVPAMSHDVGVTAIEVTQLSPSQYLLASPEGLDLSPPIAQGGCQLDQPLALGQRFQYLCDGDKPLSLVLGWQTGGVLVHANWLDGRRQQQLLLPEDGLFALTLDPGSNTTFYQEIQNFIVLGFEHILEGIDHLLLVTGLFLLLKSIRALVAAITSFTLAHSVTLVLSYLDWVALPMAPVEAAIALSIAILAVEIVKDLHQRPGLASRYPALVAGAFGLLHGLGFASALKELQVPDESRISALLGFNLGVELGQLFFLACLGVTLWIIKKGVALLLNSAQLTGLMHRTKWLAAYSMGSLAMFWTITRMV